MGLNLRVINNHGKKLTALRATGIQQLRKARRAAGGYIERARIFTPGHHAKAQTERSRQAVRHLHFRRVQFQIGTLCPCLCGQRAQHILFVDQPFGDHDVAQGRIDATLQVQRMGQII